MNVRLSPEREAEIAARHGAATPGSWSASAQIGVVTNEAGDPLAVFGGGEQDRADAAFVAAAREDVPKLLAELAAVRAERDQARADAERLRAAHFHEAARLLEDTGHDDDAVNLLDTLADGIHAEAEDASDNRRRLFVDGKGNGWISVCHDEGAEWIVPVQPEAAVEQDVRDVADETGSLREIGRCW